MKLARVDGTVVATVKDANLAGVKLLVLQPLDEDLHQEGEPLVAIDGVGVGRGEIVYWEGGPEAAHALPSGYGPTDAAVVGIVDSAHVEAAWRPPRGKQK